MKKLWISLMAVLLIAVLCCCMTACTEPPSETATGTETAKESETSSKNDTETESKNESETGSSEGESKSSEDETGEPTPPTPPLTKEEYMTALRELYADHAALPVIGYNTPFTSWENLMTAYESMLDAGINGVVTCHINGQEYLWRQLEHVDEMDRKIDLYIDFFAREDFVDFVKRSDDYYHLIKGVYLKDEPGEVTMPLITKIATDLRERVPESKNWLVGANLLPYGLEGFGGRDVTRYYELLCDYAESAKPTFLSFDRYPWANNSSYESTPWDYLHNLLLFKSVGDRYDLPVWTYIQLDRVNGQTPPTELQIRYESHLSLAAGSKALLLFEMHNMLTDTGKPNGSFYYSVESVYHAIHEMCGIYLDYDTESMILLNMDRYSNRLKEDEYTSAYLNTEGSYRQLTGADVTDSDPWVIGCMYDEEKGTGLYVVNANYEDWDEAEITLHFDGEQTYQIWGEFGLLDVGTANELTLTMEGGEGCFVVLEP